MEILRINFAILQRYSLLWFSGSQLQFASLLNFCFKKCLRRSKMSRNKISFKITIGFWWQRASWLELWPPWVIKSFNLGCAKMSCCGSHLPNKTLSGFPSISSVSHFQMTLCFNWPNTDKSFNLIESAILEAFSTDLNKLKRGQKIDSNGIENKCVKMFRN